MNGKSGTSRSSRSGYLTPGVKKSPHLHGIAAPPSPSQYSRSPIHVLSNPSLLRQMASPIIHSVALDTLMHAIEIAANFDKVPVIIPRYIHYNVEWWNFA
jgi:hypothetical protein